MYENYAVVFDLNSFIGALDKKDKDIFYKLNNILSIANDDGHNCELDLDCKLFTKFLMEHGVTVK